MKNKKPKLVALREKTNTALSHEYKIDFNVRDIARRKTKSKVKFTKRDKKLLKKVLAKIIWHVLYFAMLIFIPLGIAIWEIAGSLIHFDKMNILYLYILPCILISLGFVSSTFRCINIIKEKGSTVRGFCTASPLILLSTNITTSIILSSSSYLWPGLIYLLLSFVISFLFNTIESKRAEAFSEIKWLFLLNQHEFLANTNTRFYLQNRLFVLKKFKMKYVFVKKYVTNTINQEIRYIEKRLRSENF